MPEVMTRRHINMAGRSLRRQKLQKEKEATDKAMKQNMLNRHDIM